MEFDSTGKLLWSWHAPSQIVGTVNGVLVLDDLDTNVLNDDDNGVLASME